MTQPLPDTVAGLIPVMDSIIEESLRDGRRYGYFAALYAAMTRRVQQGILSGQFADSRRMETLCVLFAHRYLEAFREWRRGESPTMSWAMAFGATRQSDVTVVQHLLLGINAHINLDLGIAAQKTSPGAALASLEGDFDHINGVISSLMNDVKATLSRLAWPVRLLDDFTGDVDDVIANFSIRVARDEAWAFATRLNTEEHLEFDEAVRLRDDHVAALADRILRPGWVPNLILKPILWAEPRDVRTILTVLKNMSQSVVPRSS
jgi:Family of unknown function (DUF5995)